MKDHINSLNKIVNKLFSKKIYTTFMKNIKNHQKIIAIFISHKKIFKIYFKHMYLGHLLTCPNVKLGFKYGFGLDKMG